VGQKKYIQLKKGITFFALNKSKKMHVILYCLKTGPFLDDYKYNKKWRFSYLLWFL